MAHTIAVLPHKDLRNALFSEEAWKELETLGRITYEPDADRPPDDSRVRALLQDATICITSWGSPNLGESAMENASALQLVAHAAGSVKPIVSSVLWKRGVRVTSAAAAIALGVAETTLGWIIIAAKRGILASQVTRAGGWLKDMAFPPGDLPGKVIGIVGASHVGRNVIRLLKPFPVTVMVYDPYFSDDDATALGVVKSELDDLMVRSDIVSLHAPKTEETHHMINARNLALLRAGATLINTARGALIDEAAFVEHLRKDTTWAILDVTDPEPPPPEHPFRSLPNVVLTPHFAGTVESGRSRIGDCVLEEIKRFIAGEQLRYEVREEMLPRIG